MRTLTARHWAILAEFLTFAERHVTVAVSSPELSAAANVSQRTLHTICVKAFGVRPGKYLWQLRLDHVHGALRDGDPTLTSVTEIAIRYGFFELGRFSAAYKKRFSELPSETLRRSTRLPAYRQPLNYERSQTPKRAIAA